MSDLYPDAEEWVNPGDSAVVAPGGKIVAGPLRNEFGVLYADIDGEPIDMTAHEIADMEVRFD